MSSKLYVEDITIAKKLANEWIESFLGLEQEILKLELLSEDIELPIRIISLVHRIKGGSSLIGLTDITELCYEVETTLSIIKRDTVTDNTELIDSLLLAVDFLHVYIKKVLEKISVYETTDKNPAIYLEFERDQQQMQVINRIKLARDNYEEQESTNAQSKAEAQQGEANPEHNVHEELTTGLAQGVKEQFLLENTEHIDLIENNLLIRLDSDGNDREAINEIFRAVHSIKGGTGIYLSVLPTQSNEYSDLKNFSEVVHTFESLLSLIREKNSKFEANFIDLSYLTMDYLKSFINAVALEEVIDLADHVILDLIRVNMVQIQSLAGGLVQSNAKTASKQADLVSKDDEDCKSVGNYKADETIVKSSATQSIRVNQDKLDNMMNMISELFIAKNSFAHISSKLNVEYDLPEMSKEVKQVGAYVNRISDGLQNAIMSIRMVEIKTIFQKMPRVVRDIAQITGKKIDLIMEGENTEIDKTVIEHISDPLIHLIRNAADHGIENPEDRLQKGKPETGRLVLRAYNKNKYVYIEIEDDGKGIDADRMKEKAIEKGFISSAEAERLTRNQLVNLILLPGFSTAKQITEVSGRGVGMDIVKSNIIKMKGTITIESEVDKGTKMIIQLPLSLAVSRGLVVEVSGETYIFPLEHVVETVKININRIHSFNDKYFAYLRGEVIQIEWLSKIFLTGERDFTKKEMNGVVISTGTEKYAIVVDKLITEQEFVIKTLEGQLSALPGISGSTLLGNGQVVLIVNPVDIIHLAEKQELTVGN